MKVTKLKLVSPRAKELLWQLCTLIEQGLVIAYEMRRYQRIYIAGGGHEEVVAIKRRWEQRRLQRQLHQLKRSRYLRTKRQGERLIVELTNRGHHALLRAELLHAPWCQPGWCTAVTFDIPEQAAFARQQLRHFLRQSGFRQLHKSVWVSERDVARNLRHWVQAQKLSLWVHVLRAELTI